MASFLAAAMAGPHAPLPQPDPFGAGVLSGQHAGLPAVQQPVFPTYLSAASAAPVGSALLGLAPLPPASTSGFGGAYAAAARQQAHAQHSSFAGGPQAQAHASHGTHGLAPVSMAFCSNCQSSRAPLQPAVEVVTRTVEVPVKKVVERVVEVHEVIVEKRITYVPEIEVQEKIIEMPRVVFEEEVVYDEVIEYREVPVDVFEDKEVLTYVSKKVFVDKAVPVIQHVDEPVARPVTRVTAANSSTIVPVESVVEKRVPQLSYRPVPIYRRVHPVTGEYEYWPPEAVSRCEASQEQLIRLQQEAEAVEREAATVNEANAAEGSAAQQFQPPRTTVEPARQEQAQAVLGRLASSSYVPPIGGMPGGGSNEPLIYSGRAVGSNIHQQQHQQHQPSHGQYQEQQQQRPPAGVATYGSVGSAGSELTNIQHVDVFGAEDDGSGAGARGPPAKQQTFDWF